jgi:hypothetical protein
MLFNTGREKVVLSNSAGIEVEQSPNRPVGKKR